MSESSHKLRNTSAMQLLAQDSYAEALRRGLSIDTFTGKDPTEVVHP